MGHVWKNLAVVQIIMFMSFYSFSLVYGNSEIFSQFGFETPPPCVIQLMFVMGMMLAPINEVIGILMIVWSRKKEYEADAFALELDEIWSFIEIRFEKV